MNKSENTAVLFEWLKKKDSGCVKKEKLTNLLLLALWQTFKYIYETQQWISTTQIPTNNRFKL